MDGLIGRRTLAALRQLPYLSPHFRVEEVASKGNGEALVRRELLAALEVLRAAQSAPLVPVSVYRDPAHNEAVGGASRSLHVEGVACDLAPGYARVAEVRNLDLFSGIGRKRVDGTMWATHVDLRHLVGRSGTPSDPAMWTY